MAIKQIKQFTAQNFPFTDKLYMMQLGRYTFIGKERTFLLFCSVPSFPFSSRKRGAEEESAQLVSESKGKTHIIICSNYAIIFKNINFHADGFPFKPHGSMTISVQLNNLDEMTNANTYSKRVQFYGRNDLFIGSQKHKIFSS